MKLFKFLGVVLLFVTSCAPDKNHSQPVISEKTFTAASSPYTKTSLDPDGEVEWSLDDKVSVFAQEVPDRHQKFKVTEVQKNRATLEGRAFPSKIYYALYPFNEANRCSPKGLTFLIPREQVATSSTFAENLCPSYSVSIKNHFEFKNLASLIQFKLPDTFPSDCVTATLRGAGNEKLTGTFTVNPNDGVLSEEAGQEEDAEVVLKGQLKAGNTYSFVVAPVTFKDGFSIEIETAEGNKYIAETPESVSLSPSHLKEVGELKLALEGDAYPGHTEIGRLLSKAEGIMGEFISDESWMVTDGLVATEVAFVNNEGLETRTFFFEIDLNEPSITLSQTTPNNLPIGDALQSVTTQALLAEAGNPGMKIWAGSNSDFYDLRNGTNLPHGIFVHEGVEYKNFFNPNIKRKMSFFYLTKEKTVGIGLEKEYNETMFIKEIVEAFGGGELLVDKGRALNNPQPREPRTCIGMSEDGKKVYVMVVDGRRPGYSEGMTLNELAVCLQAIGVYKAINLDGGGSSTIYVRNPDKSAEDDTRFEVRNRPSDNRERGVATSLVIVSTENAG